MLHISRKSRTFVMKERLQGVIEKPKVSRKMKNLRPYETRNFFKGLENKDTI